MDQGRIAPSPVCCNPGGFLDKIRFTRISLRKQSTFHNQWRIQGSGPRDPPLLPHIFGPNGGSKGGKILLEIAPRPAHYLRVWTTHPSLPPHFISRSGSGTAHYWFPRDVWGKGGEIPQADDKLLA